MQSSVARNLVSRTMRRSVVGSRLAPAAASAALRMPTCQMVSPAAAIALPTQVRFCADKKTETPPPNEKKYLLDRTDVLQRVLEVVRNFEKVDAAKVTAESHFINDLGLDSLDVVEIVMAIEQEFVLDIPDHDAEKIQSVPEAVDYIASNPMAK